MSNKASEFITPKVGPCRNQEQPVRRNCRVDGNGTRVDSVKDAVLTKPKCSKDHDFFFFQNTPKQLVHSYNFNFLSKCVLIPK